MKKRLIGLICSLIALAICIFLPMRTVSGKAATESTAECVVELSSRRFLTAHCADTRLPMASTTKILTAIIILDDCDIRESVTVPKEAEGVEGSSVYLRAGDTYTVLDLLYGLMLRSGNDCAETLALYHSGSIEAFADAMNRKAVSIGAEHSHFANPHGLPDSTHYTTARDLALIASYAMENAKFREIVSCKYYEPQHWKNKNKMLYQYDGATGVKTGFTMNAGRCLVTSAERKGMQLVCVVLNSPQMYERTAELLDSAYERYHTVQLCDKNQPLEGFRIKEDFFYPMTEEEEKNITVQILKCDPIPEQKGQFAGIMKIFLKNSLLFSQNLYII